MSAHIDRRSLIRGAGAGAALLSLGSLPALSACSTTSTGTNTAEVNAKVKLPNYIPYPGVKPDLPANDKGVAAGFTSYPANPVAAVASPPGKGGKVTAMTLTYGAVPPAVDRNQYWQELNKRLGTELAINVVPNANYADKVATLVAGGDLPDMMLFFAALKPAQFPALLRAKFADLTELLSGDAVAQFPFLANFPTQSWRNTVYNGGIYGIPIPRGTIGTIVFIREDLVKATGLPRQPQSFAEFRELCRALTDPKKNRWALGNAVDIGGGMLAFLEQMSGAPSQWREEGGKFTHHYETEQAKVALNDLLTLIKDGVFHPDAIGADTVQVKQWLASGAIAINRDGAAAWSGNPPELESVLGAIVPPGRDGGNGVHWTGGGAFGMVAFRKADKARLTELLTIANYLAAPFGTAEHKFRKYGLEGVHHTLNGTDPVLNQHGRTELSVPVNYLSDGPAVLYEPGKAALARAQHAFQEQIMPLSVPDPTVGLISDTQMSKGATLDKRYVDTIRDICAGRKPVSAWDDAVKEWRQNGGDQIRKEYEESFALRNG
ncbi:extracellular solute-binding protein [Allorhizocola rhizosphaerae]|uniref:extracellular solute-binding protein n=1 Tax=Allorhizocola rhizosphaerae TaxID=1872709 RepID=UPI000E3B68C8|nr:extracellular solute-binding protein [Allorhizocola rhizosphaerae]